MTIHEKLLAVQSSLKAPKSQQNTFGKYKYRSCEDILEALKPLLKEQGLTLKLTDSIELIGSRYYVKATATITDGLVVDKDLGMPEYIATAAYAREEEDKKGMDGAQITGAASSYARKYALNGLFCIDDTKDADATNKHDEEKKPAKDVPKVGSSVAQQSRILELCKELQMDVQTDICTPAGFTWPLTFVQAEAVIKRLEQKRVDLAKELNKK